MKLALSSQIKTIDSYAINTLGIPAEELMGRSGKAIAKAVREYVSDGKNILILAGKGNNGGDGYAAACLLQNEYFVKIIDLFSAGQKTAEGKHYLEKYLSQGGKIISGDDREDINASIESADVIIDAIFGTGFLGSPPQSLAPIANAVNSSPAVKIAADVPLGINADDGSVNSIFIEADATVALSYMKPGLLSYPAKDFCGKIIHDTIGLPEEKIEKAIPFTNYLFDFQEAKAALPERAENTSKGSFGKLLLITGSREYPGAGLLALESALRGGAGLVAYLGEPSLSDELTMKYPEAIYHRESLSDTVKAGGVSRICDITKNYSAILIGSGSSPSPELYTLTKELITSEGAPLVLDADAINSIAAYGPEGRAIFRRARRPVVLTPHPLEFARLSGMNVTDVQANRLAVARKFAYEHGVVLLLKGAATVVTDGKSVYLNGTGSSALAKAGSGDVLAGLLVSVLASGTDPLSATALAAYLHGAAGDSLAVSYSEYGVTPSDLPREIAGVLSKLER